MTGNRTQHIHETLFTRADSTRLGAKPAGISDTPLALQRGTRGAGDGQRALLQELPASLAAPLAASFMKTAGTLAIAASMVACGTSASVAPAVAPPEAAPPPAEQTPEPEPEAAAPPVVILSEAGFQTPESVYFDKPRDQYLVSNIAGAPLDADGNGFISRLTYDEAGEIQVELKFIDGAKEGVTLNAPKGLTVAGNLLYVADIDTVRLFDVRTGEPKGSVQVPGATFLNGLATGKDDVVYLSDSGLDPKFASTGTDAVYTLNGKNLKKLLASKELGSPNGLVAGDGGVWVTTFGSGELYWVSDSGKKSAELKLPAGQGDGLVVAPDGRFLVSSWESQSVYVGTPEGEWSVEISGVEAPADIGFDCTRNKVLIPLFMKNSVVVHELGEPKKPATEESTAEPSEPPDEVMPVEEVD